MALQDFITAANTFGFGKKYNFQVEDITGGPAFITNNKDLSRVLLYIESLTLPSRKTNTTTVSYKAFDFNVPTNASFPESNRWRVTFLSDNRLLIRDIFQLWSDRLYSPAAEGGGYSSSELYNTAKFGNCNLHLRIKDDTDTNIKKIVLYGVFPTLVEGIEYNIGDNGDSVAKLPVTLSFQYFNTFNK